MNVFKHWQPLRRSPVVIWEYGLVALLLATGAGRAIAAINEGAVSQKYTQLAVGDLAWGVGAKAPDYLLLLGFVASFFLLYPALRLLAAAIQHRNGNPAEQALRYLLLLALIPAGIWVGNSCINNEPTLDLAILSVVLVLLTLGFSGGLAAKRWAIATVTEPLALVGGSILAIVLALFAGVGGLLAFGRLNLPVSLELNQAIWAAGVGVAIAAISLAIVWQSHTQQTLWAKLRWVLGGAQVGLPLCFFVLLPNPWTTGQERFYGYPVAPALYGLIGVLVLTAYIDLGYRLYKRPLVADPLALYQVLSPLCLIALLLYVKAPISGVSALPSDDYHWGEFLLPGWLLTQFHALPFRDYDPARGLVNYGPGLLANLFFDGKATSYLAVTGKPLLFLPYFAIALPTLAQSIGWLPAFLALTLMPSPGGLFEIDVMVTVGLCVLAHTFAKGRWLVWLLLWLGLCPALILFAPGNGGLLTISTSPLAAIAAYNILRHQRRSLLRWAIGVVVVAGLLLLLTPLGLMLVGALRYGIEQSALNTVAYGYEWFKSRGSQTFLSYPLWELVRTAWILMAIAVGILIYRVWVGGDRVLQQRFLPYAIPILLLSILIIPRAAGRIDPGSLSRLGFTSVWFVCLLLPIVLVKAFGQQGKAASLLLVAVLGGLLGFSLEATPSFDRLLRQPTLAIAVNAAELVNGEQVGMPALNGVIAEPAHLQRLQKIKAVMDSLLEPGETYLDLTSRNAQYFYLGYPPPIESGSVYNLVNKKQQLRAIAKLEAKTPPVIFAADLASRGNGSQIALRTHLIYRYVAERYQPVAVDQFLLLVQPDRLNRLATLRDRLAPADQSVLTIMAATDPALRLTLLDNAFRIERLEGVPSAWGRSLKSLQPEIQLIQPLQIDRDRGLQAVEALGGDRYRVTGPDPRLTIDTTALNLQGNRAGLLAFKFSCKQRQKADLGIYWTSQAPGTAQTNRVYLKPRNGQQLVPLDAAPRWLLADSIQTIQLAPFDASCPEFSLSDLALYQRKDLPPPAP